MGADARPRTIPMFRKSRCIVHTQVYHASEVIKHILQCETLTSFCQNICFLHLLAPFLALYQTVICRKVGLVGNILGRHIFWSLQFCVSKTCCRCVTECFRMSWWHVCKKSNMSAASRRRRLRHISRCRYAFKHRHVFAVK